MRNITFYTSQIEFHKTLNDFLCSGKEETKITVMDKTEAFYGDEGTCDTKYCVEHGIPLSHNGNFAGTGCIIAVKGNVIVDVTRKSNGGESLSDKFAKVLCEYFKNKGLLSVRCDNNDVLVVQHKGYIERSSFPRSGKHSEGKPPPPHIRFVLGGRRKFLDVFSHLLLN